MQGIIRGGERAVLDTKLLFSGVIAAGLSRQLIDGAKAREFELCTSEVLLAELLDLLCRGKFAAMLSQAELTLQGIVDGLLRPNAFHRGRRHHRATLLNSFRATALSI